MTSSLVTTSWSVICKLLKEWVGKGKVGSLDFIIFLCIISVS